MIGVGDRGGEFVIYGVGFFYVYKIWDCFGGVCVE